MGCRMHPQMQRLPQSSHMGYRRGIPFDDAAKEELFEAIKPDYISGVTFSGGDPLHPANHVEVAVLAKEIKETFPNKTIWLYTGFCWDEIKTLDVVKYCDVIVDGPFVQEEFDGKLHWKEVRIRESSMCRKH